MIPVSNAYEMEQIIKAHMQEALREVERNRLARAIVEKRRQRFLGGGVVGTGLAARRLWRRAKSGGAR